MVDYYFYRFHRFQLHFQLGHSPGVACLKSVIFDIFVHSRTVTHYLRANQFEYRLRLEFRKDFDRQIPLLFVETTMMNKSRSS
jgi:hypothetical protein